MCNTNNVQRLRLLVADTWHWKRNTGKTGYAEIKSLLKYKLHLYKCGSYENLETVFKVCIAINQMRPKFGSIKHNLLNDV